MSYAASQPPTNEQQNTLTCMPHCLEIILRELLTIWPSICGDA